MALLIVAVIVVNLFTAGNSSKTLDPATPAGVVQGYLNAALNGKYERAATFISSESSCDAQDLERIFIMDMERVDLVKTEIDGSQAQVWVRVDYPSGAMFDAANLEDHSYRLTQAKGRWLLTGVPWPLYDCGVIVQ